MVSKTKIQLAIVTLLVFAVSCTNKKMDAYRQRKFADSTKSTEKVFNVTIDYTEKGILKAILYSPLMEGAKKDNNPKVIMPKGIEVEFVNDKGEIQSYLRAQYAISYTKEKRIIVRRNVDVMNIKGERFLTEELIWDQSTGKIRADKPVFIFTNGQITQGTGFESDETFSKYSITNYLGRANVNNNDSLSRNRATLLSRRRNKRN